MVDGLRSFRPGPEDNPGRMNVYELHGVLHYGVGNMPGAVPHTSTYALTNATLPFQLSLAVHGIAEAIRRDPALACGVNTAAGRVTNASVAAALGRPCSEALEVLGV